MLATDYTRLPFIRRLLDECFVCVDVPESGPPDMQVTILLADVQELDDAYGPVLRLGPSDEAPNRDIRFRVPRGKVLGILHGDTGDLKRFGFAPEQG